jgi:hypothetical protein
MAAILHDLRLLSSRPSEMGQVGLLFSSEDFLAWRALDDF